jgi:hypothetical protein
MNGIYVIVWSYIKGNQIVVSTEDRAFSTYKEAEIYAREESKKRSLAYSINFVFISDRFNLAYYL